MIPLSRLQFLKTILAAAAVAILPAFLARAIFPRDVVDTLKGEWFQMPGQGAVQYGPVSIGITFERIEEFPVREYQPGRVGTVCPLPSDAPLNVPGAFTVANGRDWLLVKAERVQTPRGPRFQRRWLLSKPGGWVRDYQVAAINAPDLCPACGYERAAIAPFNCDGEPCGGCGRRLLTEERAVPKIIFHEP